MHRAACGRASGLRGGAEVLGKGVRKCSGRAKVFDGKCVVRSAGVRRRCEGEWKCSEGGEKMLGVGADLRRGMGGEVGGCASGLRGRAEVCGKGVSQCGGERRGFDGEWVVRSAGLTHFRRSSSRVRVLLYIRPPRHRREIKAMGQKRRSRECSSPAKASAPAPSAFIFPCPRSHFRVRVHTSPAWPSAAPTKNSASRRSSYPQWVIHGKVIHIVARRPVQNVLALAPAHAYI